MWRHLCCNVTFLHLGKTRAVISIPVDISKEDAIAKGKEAVADKLTGTIVKEIYVPKKIINIVQK